MLVQPDDDYLMTTAHITSLIDRHADELALILLPGIQYYSGQLLDIPTITAHAHAKGVTIGWDLAHAAGNVELKLHDWDVDFACWCTYKYMVGLRVFLFSSPTKELTSIAIHRMREQVPSLELLCIQNMATCFRTADSAAGTVATSRCDSSWTTVSFPFFSAPSATL